MSTYLNISQRHIQAYLNRTPEKLRLRRGASHAICHDELRESIEGFLCDNKGVKFVDEAGKVDGEISLVVDQGVDVDAVGKELVSGYLRPHLPAAVFEAVHGKGSSYVDAYNEEMRPKQNSGETSIFRPPLYDLPTIERCNWCNLDPGTRLVSEPTDPRKEFLVCSDCRSRSELALSHRAEDRVLETEYARMERCLTFGDLAHLDLRPEGLGAKPRLATVYADGNNISSYMGRILNDDRLKDVCKDLNEATELALNCGISSLLEERPGCKRLPAIVHIVGGDDVLITVPGSGGWTFARRFLEAFTDLLETERLTASAGLVFHHYTLPFDIVTGLASGLLKAAKSFTKGGAASVAWQDTTQDGSTLIADGRTGRRCWKLCDLEEKKDLLDQLARMPRSSYQTLRRLAGEEVTGRSSERLRHWKNRDPIISEVLAILGLDEGSADSNQSEMRPYAADIVETASWWNVDKEETEG